MSMSNACTQFATNYFQCSKNVDGTYIFYSETLENVQSETCAHMVQNTISYIMFYNFYTDTLGTKVKHMF